MKLVLQIAAGILLAAALAVGAIMAPTVYAKYQAEQAREEFLQQQAEKFDYDRECNEGEAIADCIVRRVHEEVEANDDQS